MKYTYISFVLLFLIGYEAASSQSNTNKHNDSTKTWIDSLSSYGREVVMPANEYKWDWGQATMLNSIVHLYNLKPNSEKKIYWAIQCEPKDTGIQSGLPQWMVEL